MSIEVDGVQLEPLVLGDVPLPFVASEPGWGAVELEVDSQVPLGAITVTREGEPVAFAEEACTRSSAAIERSITCVEETERRFLLAGVDHGDRLRVLVEGRIAYDRAHLDERILGYLSEDHALALVKWGDLPWEKVELVVENATIAIEAAPSCPPPLPQDRAYLCVPSAEGSAGEPASGLIADGSILYSGAFEKGRLVRVFTGDDPVAANIAGAGHITRNVWKTGLSSFVLNASDVSISWNGTIEPGPWPWCDKGASLRVCIDEFRSVRVDAAPGDIVEVRWRGTTALRFRA